MAIRRPPIATPVQPILSVEQIRRRIASLQDCIDSLEAFEPQKVPGRYQVPQVTALEAAIKDALALAFGVHTAAYDRYSGATTLDQGPHYYRSDFAAGSVSEARDLAAARKYFSQGKENSIILLKQAIKSLEEEIADRPERATAESQQSRSETNTKKIFVVHGHAEAALQSVARFLERLGLDAVILREQPDQGRTIIEKFEACASEVGFAVVLLTPDDLVGPAGESGRPSRARQNVIFELGYLVGRLGRGRACLLRMGEVEIPSDLHGVIYTDLDAAEGWKMKLVKELKAAKLDFDANRAWG